MTKVSARGASIQESQFAMFAFPLYALWMGGLALPLDDPSVAIAHADDLSTYIVIASSTGSHDPRESLAAWFAGLAGNRIVEFETVESGGRIAIVESNQAVSATEDTFYWMSYFDVGEFGPTPPPRPALRDLVIDTLHALP